MSDPPKRVSVADIERAMDEGRTVDLRPDGTAIVGELGSKALQEQAETIERMSAEIARLRALIDQPELEAFWDGAKRAAAKADLAADRIMTGDAWLHRIAVRALLAYRSVVLDEIDAALHHSVETAAAIARWHRSLLDEKNEGKI